MNDLMNLTKAGSFNEAKSLPRYESGERISFPMAGNVIEGVVDGYAGTRVVRVLSFLFGQERAIEIPLAN